MRHVFFSEQSSVTVYDVQFFSITIYKVCKCVMPGDFKSDFKSRVVHSSHKEERKSYSLNNMRATLTEEET